jgi:hypothetical protein
LLTRSDCPAPFRPSVSVPACLVRLAIWELGKKRDST